MHGTQAVHHDASWSFQVWVGFRVLGVLGLGKPWSFKGARAPTHCADGLQRGDEPRPGLAELAELAGPRVAAAAGKVAQHAACVGRQTRFRYVPG